MLPKKTVTQPRERPPKSPRVPTFPPQVVPLVNTLNGIIDAPETTLERRAMAYGVLTRLCVQWAQPAMREGFLIHAELTEYSEGRPSEARCKLVGNPPLINDMVCLMLKLFPGGEGLPPQEGCGPL